MRKIIAGLVFGMFFLVGCDSEILFSGLPESEANEIVAVLLSENLVADKVADKIKWNLPGLYHSLFVFGCSICFTESWPPERTN